VNNRITTDKNTWAHVVTAGSARRENTEGKHGEGMMPNADVQNTEDDRCPTERETDQHQQHDDTAT